MDNKNNWHGSLRKSKRGLVGVLLFSSALALTMVTNSVSADEVSVAPSTASTAVVTGESGSVTSSSTVSNDKGMSSVGVVEENKNNVSSKSDNNDEKQNAQTSNVVDQATLDKGYKELTESVNSQGFVHKEDEKVVHDTAEDADKDLKAQEKSFEEVSKNREALNKDLDNAVEKVKDKVDVTFGETHVYPTIEDGNKDIEKQIAELNKLASVVTESEKRLEDAQKAAKAKNIVFKNPKTISVNLNHLDSLETQLNEAESALKYAVVEQEKANKQLNKLVADAKDKGVSVQFSGVEVVDAKDVDKELSKTEKLINEAIKNKEAQEKAYESALAKWEAVVKAGNEKVEKDYKEALQAFNKKVELVKAENKLIEAENQATLKANANAKAELSKDSTAKKTGENYQQTLSGNSSTHTETITNVEAEFKPTVNVQIYDFSSSNADKLINSLKQGRMLIEKALKHPDSKVIIQTYTMNFPDSYRAAVSSDVRKRTDNSGTSTKLLSKQEAIGLIDKLLQLKSPSFGGPYETTGYNGYFTDIAETLGSYRYTDGDDKKDVPFEDIVTKLVKPSDTVSVIQFTDGWDESVEHMDETFANWAKSRAKTFMSVINRNNSRSVDTNSHRSIDDMTRLGHPNIFDMTGMSEQSVDKELLDKFLETAVEKVTKATKDVKSKAVVSIKPDENVTLLSAELVSPTGKVDKLSVTNNQVEYSGLLSEKGEYKVNYVFASKGNKEAKVSGSFKVDANTDAKNDNFIPMVQGKLKPLKEVPNNAPVKEVYKVPEKPKKQDSASVTIPKIVVSTEVAYVEGAKYEAHKVNFEVHTHPVSFKEKAVVESKPQGENVVLTHNTPKESSVKLEKHNENELPNTGDSSSRLAASGFASIMGGLLLLGLNFKKLKKK